MMYYLSIYLIGLVICTFLGRNEGDPDLDLLRWLGVIFWPIILAIGIFVVLALLAMFLTIFSLVELAYRIDKMRGN